MTEHKFTDEEIIRALEICQKAKCWGDCEDMGCPAAAKQGCRFYLRTDEDYEGVVQDEMLKDALDLINRQNAEIERMKAGKPCSIGDKLYIIVPGGGKDGGDGIEINRVTEVGERFIFFSRFAPPKDDILNNVEIADLGKEVFLDEAAFKQELERRRLEYDRGRGAGGV